MDKKYYVIEKIEDLEIEKKVGYSEVYKIVAVNSLAEAYRMVLEDLSHRKIVKAVDTEIIEK